MASIFNRLAEQPVVHAQRDACRPLLPPPDRLRRYEFVIVVENLTVRLGTFSLEQISFEVGNGEYAVLMGKTGSGKTTILEAICGLKSMETGSIFLDGTDVARRKPAERGIGYVPQDGALFGTMTIRDHLAFALLLRKWSRRAVDHRVAELADLLNLEHLLSRKPHGLSGGEIQRVALGRALANHPAFLCLDEPLSALDEETRGEMYELLKSVQRHTGVTTLHVTHSRNESHALADRMLLLKDGRVHNLSPQHSFRRHKTIADGSRARSLPTDSRADSVRPTADKTEC